MADWKDIGIADLERQIAELRAEYLNASKDAMELAGKLNAAEADNARLRALPLKDEVERVVDDAQTWISENVRPSDAVGNEILCEIRALLSRIRAGVQEGKQRFAVQSPTGAHVGLWETKAFADKIAKDEGPGYVVIELIEIAASPSVSDGGSRNG